ncbi:MAG: cell division protein ZapA [Acidobacteriota bacterium]
MTSRSITSTDVEIFGAVYHVRGEQDRETLHRLAAIVDRKMREIGDHVPVVDSGKIAILAALNLADELVQNNQQQEGERAGIDDRMRGLIDRLDAAIDG